MEEIGEGLEENNEEDLEGEEEEEDLTKKMIISEAEAEAMDIKMDSVGIEEDLIKEMDSEVMEVLAEIEEDSAKKMDMEVMAEAEEASEEILNLIDNLTMILTTKKEKKELRHTFLRKKTPRTNSLKNKSALA